MRVLLISGSGRRQYNCPGVDSKSRTLMLRMKEGFPDDWEVDIEDLGNVFARARIQSCNACALLKSLLQEDKMTWVPIKTLLFIRKNQQAKG